MSLKIKILIFLISILILTTKASAENLWSVGYVKKVETDQIILAESANSNWSIGETVSVVSQNAKLGVYAFVEVESVQSLPNGKFDLKLRLLKQSRLAFVQSGDIVKKIDLTSDSDDYFGSTALIIKKNDLEISSKYRPLVYQGISIGETAQTLFENEMLVSFYGKTYFGLTNWLTINSIIIGNFVGGPNISAKARFYDSQSTTLAAGLSFIRLVQKDQANLNFNFYWDSISTDSLISHIYLSLGLISWDGAGESAAIKALTSSSFQTGYEIISNNWDRLLVGPSYNFQNKALGGYISYVWIFDRFHTQISLNSTDITKYKVDPKDGYYALFDMYWRF